MANKETVLIEFHMKNEGMKEVVINAEKVNMSFKKVKKSSGEVGKGFFDITNRGRFMSNMFSRLRSKLLLVSFALGLVSKITSSLTKKYMEQEKAVKKLEAAVGKNIQGLVNQAAALQQVTTFGDEVIINAQALIGAYVQDEEHLKAATEATLDLAAAKGMDLATAADLVGKSLGSSTNALSRYGVSVVGAAGSTKRLESLTKNVAILFGGQAAAETKTLTGALAQMWNALGDTNEILGLAVSPAIIEFSKKVKEAAEVTGDFLDDKLKTDLENVRDELSEMGVDVTDLNVIIAKNKLKDFMEGLDPKIVSKITDESFDLKNITKELADAEILYQNSLKQTAHEIHTVSDEFGDYEKVLKKSEESTLGLIDKTVLWVLGAGVTGKTQKEKMTFLDKWMPKFINANRVEREEIKETNEWIVLRSQISKEDAEVNKKRVDSISEIIKSFKEMKELEEFIASLTETPAEVGFLEKILGALADEGKMKELKESIKEWGNAVTKIATNYLEAEQARLDASKSTELAAANEIKWEKKRQSEIDKINKKYEAEQDALNKKNKRMQRTQTVINTASGIMGAYADTSTTNMLAKHVMAVLIAAQGASQLATIDAAKYRYGGFVGGRSHSQGGTMIEAERGEFVMRREAVEAVGIETMNRINQGGGAGNINISFNGNVLSKDFIEDEAIPQIKEAIRRGADIGVG